MRRSRGGAREQNEHEPENGSKTPSKGPILMTYTLNDWQFFTDFTSLDIMTRLVYGYVCNVFLTEFFGRERP